MAELPNHSNLDQSIADQLERTNKLIQQLENQRYLQMIDRPGKFLFFSFLQGVAVALGSTVGVAIVFTIVVYTLQKLQVFTPLSNQIHELQQTLKSLPGK